MKKKKLYKNIPPAHISPPLPSALSPHYLRIISAFSPPSLRHDEYNRRFPRTAHDMPRARAAPRSSHEAVRGVTAADAAALDVPRGALEG